MKALLAEDHPMFRTAMSQFLREQLEFNVVESTQFSQAFEHLQQDDDIDLVFLDLNLPDVEGLSGLIQIRNAFPNSMVIIVSAEENAEVITTAMDLGACAYIPKSETLETIASAVNRVLDGYEWLPQNFVRTEKKSEQIDYANKLALLTPHQLKVLSLIAKGLLNKQIAYELDISESTVKQHASAVLKKLELYNRTQAGVVYNQLMHVENN